MMVIFKQISSYWRCILAFWSLMVVFAVQPSYSHGLRYHEFTSIDWRVGMDASVVNCVVQDNSGLIWMGTNRGLYSFDGYRAMHHSAVSSAVEGGDGVVYCALMVDSVHLWLGTDNGLVIFNTYTDSFEPSPVAFPKDIRAITRINGTSFWVGSLNGLFRYDTSTKQLDKIIDPAIPHQAVYSILRYDENNYFFGTYNGLCRYNVPARKFSSVTLTAGKGSINKLVLSILPDYDRRCIWVGIEGGLYGYYPSSQQSIEVPVLKGNSVKSLLLDNQQCLWAGTDNGLYVYNPSKGDHRVIRHNALNDRSLINNIVWSVFADKEQNIWLGTEAGVSLYVYNNRYKLHSVSEVTGSTEGNQIISVLSDSKGNVWLGGTNGLIKVGKDGEKTIWYQQNNPQNPLPHNRVRSIFEDADGDIWIATDGSICRYDPRTLQFIRYQIEDDSRGRNANWAYAICQDETRKLWVATCLGGLFVVDKQKLLASAGTTYVAEQNYFTHGQNKGLSGDMLQFLSVDGDKNIWAATYRAGLNKIDRQNQAVLQFTSQNQANTLPSDDVTAMVADGDRYVWVALRNQLLRMDTRSFAVDPIVDARLTNLVINSMVGDGKRIWLSTPSGLFVVDKASLKVMRVNVGGNFFSSVHYSSYSQKVVVGGLNEYVEFSPEAVLMGEDQNQLFLTTLWVNDRLVQTNDTSTTNLQLSQSIRYTKRIELPHNLNNLSFAFSELIYNQGQNVQYSYQLKGVDDDWRYTSGNNNRLSYSNLRPGNYEFLMSRIGVDGRPMDKPLTLSVTIHHPWYSTWWAKLAYSILFVMLILAFVNYFMVLNRLRYERLEKIKTMELTAHKIDFLTNISHELKTPLSLIIGPLGKMMEQVKNTPIKEQLSDVRHNAMKMGSLIHQLMEASRLETSGVGLIVSKTDVVELTRSVVSVFQKPLSDREVSVDVSCNVEPCYIEADVLKLEAILNNILSNAAKFAPNGSGIFVTIEATDDAVNLVVRDEGPGIDANDLPHVFERFYQSKRLLAQNKEGTGVGLSIVKEYVQLHRGTVQVVSDGKRGTSVEVVLPIKQIAGENDDLPQASAKVQPFRPESAEMPLLLIVEDNLEILSFIAKSLSSEFRCITAHNGKLGLEAALEHLPDVIVTDIMMPVMDGMEMCRKLKENIATSLTPVVMLTAKDDKNTELSGYRTGADAFIAKPFEIGYLSDRLHQLLKGRKLLVQKARQEAIIQPKDMEASSADERFLATITQIIESEITQSDLNVNLLSEKSGYSAKQVYRRIKSLTGQTAVDYIRSVRLKKAAMLLSRKTFTVAEVMYMVGFSNHSYFAKRFYELFGKTPKEYMDGLN
jgi:signal transduction histidine kinase/ligand-binding sensor domain-containing protein/DNA-binding response OmpR family regulator